MQRLRGWNELVPLLRGAGGDPVGLMRGSMSCSACVGGKEESDSS